MTSAKDTRLVKTPTPQYITLLALTIATVALATDVMLPALGLMGQAFHLSQMNDTQYVVSVFFLGFALGQFVVGPLSDSLGRRPVVLWGFALFILGCVISIIAETWSMMLIGRFLQGLGASAPRVVSVAIIRDDYEGRVMARIMSIIMAIFIIVPTLAPSLGQMLIYLGGWRMAFWGLVLVALPNAIWFFIAMPESLDKAKRIPFSLGNIGHGLGVILRNPVTMGYTIASGFIFGPFLGYLSTTQQIFQTTFDKGDYFALYFAVASLSLGSASLFNARLVMRMGMRRLSTIAIIGLTVWSMMLVVIFNYAYSGMPDFTLFMLWLLVTFLFLGILFGNLTALAMEPLGAFAGLGSAFVGALSTLISLPLGWMVSDLYDGTVMPLVAGFASLGFVTLIVMMGTEYLDRKLS